MKDMLLNLITKLLGSKKASVVLAWALARILTPLLAKVGVPVDAVGDIINGLHDAIMPLITWLIGQSVVDTTIEVKRPQFNDKGQLIDKNGAVIEPPAI